MRTNEPITTGWSDELKKVVTQRRWPKNLTEAGDNVWANQGSEQVCHSQCPLEFFPPARSREPQNFFSTRGLPQPWCHKFEKSLSSNGRAGAETTPKTFEKVSKFFSERFSQLWISKPQFWYPSLGLGSHHRIRKPLFLLVFWVYVAVSGSSLRGQTFPKVPVTKIWVSAPAP